VGAYVWRRDHDYADTLRLVGNFLFDFCDLIRIIHLNVDNYLATGKPKACADDMRNLHPLAKVTPSYFLSYYLEAAIAWNHDYVNTLDLGRKCAFHFRNIVGRIHLNIDCYHPTGKRRACIDDMGDLLPLGKVTASHLICYR